MKNSLKILSGVLISFLVILYSGCRSVPVYRGKIDSVKVTDGTFQGKCWRGPNRAVVEVTITNGKIENIRLLKHLASWKGKRAEETIIKRIIEKQSTRVDAVTGATGSSDVIMNAIQRAINKAYEKE